MSLTLALRACDAGGARNWSCYLDDHVALPALLEGPFDQDGRPLVFEAARRHFAAVGHAQGRTCDCALPRPPTDAVGRRLADGADAGRSAVGQSGRGGRGGGGGRGTGVSTGRGKGRASRGGKGAGRGGKGAGRGASSRDVGPSAGRGRGRLGRRANVTSLFGGVPLYMLEERPAKLMKHAPPYGYKIRGFHERELLAKRRNATLPAVRSFGSCAVVGSSGTLRQSALGEEIDAHDAVIRVNGAPLPSNLVAYTGRRTTWRVFSSPHAASDWRFHEQRMYPDTPLLVVCDRPYVYSCQNVLYATRKPNLHGVSPIFYAAVRRHADPRKHAIPLTGVVAVAAAIRSCARVDVYGMSTMQSRHACFYYWSCGQTDARYHSRPGDAEFHDFRGNARALLRWNASGHIRIRG